MKKIFVVILLSIFALHSFAQGIDFQHLSLEEALAKAKAENKLVFIDFYTVWCVPCRTMSLTVFPDPSVGAYYNKEFINIKLDSEKEGLPAARKYKVSSYPTMMFLNAEGEMVYKKIGTASIENTVLIGKDAVAAVNNNLSIAALKGMYPEKQNDESFLKLYIKKMIEYRESPTDAIDAWLKVQTEIKEKQAEMMEFFFDHYEYLQINSRAEEILNKNYDEYFDIATRLEEKKLANLRKTMVKNTGDAAYAQKNPELLRAYIDRLHTYPATDLQNIDFNRYEIDYLLFSKDYDGFKKKTVAYLDSLTTAKSIDQIRAEDKLTYEDFKKSKYTPSLQGNLMLEKMEKGQEAQILTQKIERASYNYLKHSSTKNDYKNLNRWVDYGSQLVPEDYDMDNLRAEILFQQGDKKEALKYKQAALDKLTEKDKQYSLVKTQLEKMQQEAGK